MAPALLRGVCSPPHAPRNGDAATGDGDATTSGGAARREGAASRELVFVAPFFAAPVRSTTDQRVGQCPFARGPRNYGSRSQTPLWQQTLNNEQLCVVLRELTKINPSMKIRGGVGFRAYSVLSLNKRLYFAYARQRYTNTYLDTLGGVVVWGDGGGGACGGGGGDTYKGQLDSQ